jgi:poly(A) polymerase
MLERAILAPVLPEIEPETLGNLQSLVETERTAGIVPDPLRRLAAILPRDAGIADDIGVRLRLSNKARKRLGCAVGAHTSASPQALAYEVGTDCAVDRLLLSGDAAAAAEVAEWKVPRLPIGGGALIDRGLAAGPIVARTLRAIEDQWVKSGFPTGSAFERIVDDALAKAN